MIFHLMQKITSRRRNEAGFSLIELLIASAIFVTCLLSVYSMFVYSMRSIKKSEDYLLADQIAKKEMEYVKTLDWDTLDDPLSNALNNRPNVEITTSLNGVQVTNSFSSNIMVTDLEANVKVARILIQWSTASPSGNKVDSLELFTYINNPDQ